MTSASSGFFGLILFVWAMRPKGIGCAVDTRAVESLQQFAMRPQRQRGGSLWLLKAHRIFRMGAMPFVCDAIRPKRQDIGCSCLEGPFLLVPSASSGVDSWKGGGCSLL